MGKPTVMPGFKIKKDSELTKEDYTSILKLGIGGQLVNEASGELAGKFSAPSYVKAVSTMEKTSERYFTPLYEQYFKANEGLTRDIYDTVSILAEVFSGRDIVEISKISDAIMALHYERDTMDATIHRILKKHKVAKVMRAENNTINE